MNFSCLIFCFLPLNHLTLFLECLRVLLLWRDTITKAIKGKRLIGVGLQLERFSLLSSVRKYGSMLVDLVLEKELKGLHLETKAARGRLSSTLGGTSALGDLKAHLYTFSNKTTPPPKGPHLLIVPFPMVKHSNTWGQTYSNHHTEYHFRLVSIFFPRQGFSV